MPAPRLVRPKPVPEITPDMPSEAPVLVSTEALAARPTGAEMVLLVPARTLMTGAVPPSVMLPPVPWEIV